MDLVRTKPWSKQLKVKFQTTWAVWQLSGDPPIPQLKGKWGRHKQESLCNGRGCLQKHIRSCFPKNIFGCECSEFLAGRMVWNLIYEKKYKDEIHQVDISVCNGETYQERRELGVGWRLWNSWTSAVRLFFYFYAFSFSSFSNPERAYTPTNWSLLLASNCRKKCAKA